MNIVYAPGRSVFGSDEKANGSSWKLKVIVVQLLLPSTFSIISRVRTSVAFGSTVFEVGLFLSASETPIGLSWDGPVIAKIPTGMPKVSPDACFIFNDTATT